MTYSEFKKVWTGRSVDYDHVYSAQCVDLILQYLKDCHGIPSGVWGNAIDYWTKPTATLLKKFMKVTGTAAKQGDIVVLKGTATNQYGHIGICDSATTTTVRVLEQNALGTGTGTGRNAIGIYRDIPKTRIAGLLRVKPTASTAPAPAYTRVLAGEGLSHISKRVGFRDWFLPTAWVRLSKLNGWGINWLGFNRSLRPTQRIRVR